MRSINIIVRDKIATNPTHARYVCGNSDFVIRFDFDEEWNEIKTKTARFVYGNSYQDQVFEGNECPVPIISNVNVFEVGVFAGNLRTSTSASVPADKSILCKGGLPANPAPNVYSQIMELLNKGGGGNSLPETADPLKQLVTDESGNVAWEDRLAYKTTAEAEVVNLAATELTGGDDNGDGTNDSFYLYSTWAADIEAGTMCDVVYNGTSYACQALAFEQDGLAGCLLGNTEQTGVAGGNPDAPFVMVCFPNSKQAIDWPILGVLQPLDGATSVTLSVTSKQTQTTVKPVDPELLGIKKIDIIVAEDDTVSCDFPFEEAWAMDEGLLSASIRVQVMNASYTTHTNTASYYAPTVYKYEQKMADGSSTTRFIHIACRSTPDMDLTDTNEFTRHIQWAKVVVQGGASQTELSYMTEQGAPMTRAGSARHYSISYSRMMAAMGFLTVEATYDGSATVINGSFSAALEAAIAGRWVRLRLIIGDSEGAYLPMTTYSDKGIDFVATDESGLMRAYYTPDGALKVTIVAAE